MNPCQTALPIWHPSGSSLNQTIEFRSSFAVVSPQNCRIYLHVATNYALYINDTYVYSGSFPDFEDHKVMDEIDLSAVTVRGMNTFRLTAYYQGEDSFLYRMYGAEAIFAIMEGEDELLISDAGVPCRIDTRFEPDVPYISDQLSFSFSYQDKARPQSFMPAVVVGDRQVLYPRPIQRLVVDPPAPSYLVANGSVFYDSSLEGETVGTKMQKAFRRLQRPDPIPAFPSAAGLTGSDSDLIFDLKRELAGFLMIDIELERAGEISISWGEHLQDQHVRSRISNREFACKISLSSGRTSFFYPLKRLAFRYLELHIDAPSYTLYYAGIRPSRYPLSELNEFLCNDRLHEQIFKTSVRTLLLCMFEHYVDCPWREQSLYTMDSRNQMLFGYYAFNEYAFPRSSLEMIAGSIREDDFLELISPGRAPITIPCYSAIFPVQVFEYVKHSEDLLFLRKVFPVCRRILNNFLTRVDSSDLIPRPTGAKYWNYYEWEEGLSGDDPTPSDRPIYDAPLNAFAMMMIKSMASLETILGNPSKGALLLERADALAMAYHKTFFDTTKNAYATFSCDSKLHHYAELTQALSLTADCVPEARKDQVLAHLSKHSSSLPLIPISLSHSIFKYEVLLTQPEHYAREVFDDVAEIFAAMLKDGATTFYETIYGADDFAQAGSLCHGWSAIPAYLYLKYCVDIKREGTRLGEELTGINQPLSVKRLDPSKMIQNEY